MGRMKGRRRKKVTDSFPPEVASFMQQVTKIKRCGPELICQLLYTNLPTSFTAKTLRNSRSMLNDVETCLKDLQELTTTGKGEKLPSKFREEAGQLLIKIRPVLKRCNEQVRCRLGLDSQCSGLNELRKNYESDLSEFRKGVKEGLSEEKDISRPHQQTIMKVLLAMLQGVKPRSVYRSQSISHEDKSFALCILGVDLETVKRAKLEADYADFLPKYQRDSLLKNQAGLQDEEEETDKDKDRDRDKELEEKDESDDRENSNGGVQIQSDPSSNDMEIDDTSDNEAKQEFNVHTALPLRSKDFAFNH